MNTVFYKFSNSERLKLVQSVQQAPAPVTNTSSKKGLLLYFHLRKHRELLSSAGSSSSRSLNGGGPLGSVLKLFSSLPTPSGIIQFLDFIYQLYGSDPQICIPALTFPLTPDPLSNCLHDVSTRIPDAPLKPYSGFFPKPFQSQTCRPKATLSLLTPLFLSHPMWDPSTCLYLRGTFQI